jgi:hypothetical protein
MVDEHLRHRYLKKSRLLKFCYVLAARQPFPRAFLRQPLTVLTRQARLAAVCAINQSIFLRCLLFEGEMRLHLRY